MKTLENDIKICARCVMDTTVPDIIFDEKGNCQFCNNYENEIIKDLHVDLDGPKRLENLLNKIRGKNNTYDCVIGLSGGVDSSYVAYLAKEVYGLKPLAVHLDNGWNSELSVANIEQIVKKLNIDLQTYVLDWNEFRDIQLSFLKSSISNIEIPTDHAIWALLVRTAIKMKIPYIISGNNVVTESIMPESWLYGSKDFKLIKSIHNRFGRYKMNTFPKLTTLNYIDFLLYRGIKWIPMLNYVHFNKANAKEILIKELGWRDYGGKHYESIYTRFFHAYYLPQKFGYDLRKSYLSALICSGQISRQVALDELSKPTASEEVLIQDRDYVVKKLGLTISEFEMILKQPNKTYSNYPNNEKLWHIMRFFVKYARNHITKVSN